MGKKKDKLLAAQRAAAGGQPQQQQPVPWRSVDADPISFLVGPEV
jgi:hypothetical protein